MHIPTIVYVEDNAGDVLLLRQGFEAHFFNVNLQVIPDGEQALRYLEIKATAKDAPPPDLILLDLHLPKVDGDQLWHFILHDPYLKGIPTFIFHHGQANSHIKVAEDHRVTKPTDWKGYLKLAERLIAAIEAWRKPKG